MTRSYWKEYRLRTPFWDADKCVSEQVGGRSKGQQNEYASAFSCLNKDSSDENNEEDNTAGLESVPVKRDAKQCLDRLTRDQCGNMV